jgi:hypothetical protein
MTDRTTISEQHAGDVDEAQYSRELGRCAVELFGVPWPLAPILIIACGLALLWAALRSKDLMRK